MTRLIIGPFNRVEGDLEVKLDMEEGRVRAAHVVSPLYRGFETILKGKAPEDALVFVPRICGICSVSQSVAAARALEQLSGVEASANGTLCRNLILATENVGDHLTHFYLFFMPDFTRPTYVGEPWHESIEKRFLPVKGDAAADFLPARAAFFHLTGILAGKWPHTLSIQPGGSTRSVAAHEQVRMTAILTAFRRFLERHLFGLPLEAFADFSSISALLNWVEKVGPNHSDFTRFFSLSQALTLAKSGRAYDHFLSYGAYHDAAGDPLFTEGVWDGNGRQSLNTADIAEDVSQTWMVKDEMPRHPSIGRTEPQGNLDGGYSWCKAPRLAGHPMEAGALARQVVSGHPLIRDCVAQDGGNVESRVLARLLEVALLVPKMEKWVKDINPAASFRNHPDALPDGDSVGLTEAARGSLGHWLSVRKGVIDNYQIIAPTTWNFSPRDAKGLEGPLEKALVGATLRDGEGEPVSVQHIVRSFDPCMVCTVH